MSKVKEISNYLWDHIDEETCEVVDIEGVDSLEGLTSHINEKFGCSIELKHIGGYDSPGHDVDCYAWAGIVDGELFFTGIQVESY